MSHDNLQPPVVGQGGNETRSEVGGAGSFRQNRRLSTWGRRIGLLALLSAAVGSCNAAWSVASGRAVPILGTEVGAGGGRWFEFGDGNPEPYAYDLEMIFGTPERKLEVLTSQDNLYQLATCEVSPMAKDQYLKPVLAILEYLKRGDSDSLTGFTERGNTSFVQDPTRLRSEITTDAPSMAAELSLHEGNPYEQVDILMRKIAEGTSITQDPNDESYKALMRLRSALHTFIAVQRGELLLERIVTDEELASSKGWEGVPRRIAWVMEGPDNFYIVSSAGVHDGGVDECNMYPDPDQ